MFNRQVYENSRPDGIALMEIVDEREGAPRQFVPLKHTELHGEVDGPLAALRLVHTYGYSRDQCDRVLEVAYHFPLPGDAAVTGVRVRFGLVEIVTQLKERARAQAEYDEAVQQGKQAALLTRESPDVFTLRVAGIQPDEPVVVETQYVQLARPQADAVGWLLRVPLTTSPRFVRQDEAGSPHAEGQPLALLRDPCHRFSLDLVIHDAGEVSSPTHAIDSMPEGASANDLRVRLHDEQALPDRDLILTWTPHQETGRPTLGILLYDDPEDEQVYFLALVAPPTAYQPGSGPAREVILLVDHSGSMSGAKWEASDWAVNSFLSGLTERDRFALGLFHNTTQWFDRKPALATPERIEKAREYLDKNRDSGGTELGIALEQTLQLDRGQDGGQGRHVLIVTDAEVTDAARILRLADQEAQRPRRRRISVLCIDAAPNAFLANELAERGGGVAHFLTSSPDEEDITTALEGVLADWAEPVLVGLRLEVDRAGGSAVGREVLQRGPGTVIDLGDLPCGRAVWAAGRVPRGRGGSLTFKLTAGGKTIVTCTLSLPGNGQPAVKALFGARRLLGLEYLIGAGHDRAMLEEQLARLGYEPRSILGEPGSALYAENARQSAQDALRPLLVRESLAYGIACAETAFVAVRTEAGKPVEESVAVANALPAGWSEEFLSKSAMPMGAIPSGAVRSASLGTGLGAGLGIRAPLRQAMAAPPAAAPAPRPSQVAAPGIVVFSGAPAFVNGQAVLFDSTQEEKLPATATLSRLQVRFEGPSPRPEEMDRLWTLLIFVDDMALPRAQVRLADLIRAGGARPLNLRRAAGQAVRVVLSDPSGTWGSGSWKIRVSVTV